MAKFGTVGGVTGVGFLAVGLALPKLIEGLPESISYALTGIGLILLLTAFIWSLMNKDEAPAPTAAQSTTGDGAHNIAHSTVNFNQAPPPPKHSSIQELKTMPPFLGGNWVLDLGGIGTLRMKAPYNQTSVTVALDMVPTKHPGVEGDGIKIEGVWSHVGVLHEIHFDTGANKRHVIETGGRKLR